MPQADEELRTEWRHGEIGGGEEAATAHLRAAGYRLTRAWTWTPPSNHTITDRDRSAILYMVYEWDYGGITPAEQR